MSKDMTKEAADVTIQDETTAVSAQVEGPMGFEDEDAGDVTVPRIKVINALSPERKDKIAEEGDIINSLTKEKLNDKVFVPVFMFKNIILWKDRADGGGIEAISRDCRIMIPMDGSAPYPVGTLADFDNSKKGRDALPKATRYINFFGFFEGERMPVILSFAKTNYNEGKKIYSLAKVTMQNMWNYGYKLTSKLMAKSGNEWYNIIGTANGATSDEDREFATALFKMYRNTINDVKYDMDDGGSYDEAGSSNTAAAESAEY